MFASRFDIALTRADRESTSPMLMPGYAGRPLIKSDEHWTDLRPACSLIFSRTALGSRYLCHLSRRRRKLDEALAERHLFALLGGVEHAHSVAGRPAPGMEPTTTSPVTAATDAGHRLPRRSPTTAALGGTRGCGRTIRAGTIATRPCISWPAIPNGSCWPTAPATLAGTSSIGCR